MIRATDCLTVSACRMGPRSPSTRRRPFRKLARMAGWPSPSPPLRSSSHRLENWRASARRTRRRAPAGRRRGLLEPFADFPLLLHAPTSMVHVGERLGERQGCRQAELRVPGDVFHEADAEAPAAQRGFVPGRIKGHGPPGLARGDEVVEHGVGGLLDAEDEVQPAVLVGQRHREGPIAPVVHDDVALGGVVQVRERGLALVLVVEQVEVDRDAVAQPVEDADHALGVVGAVAHAEAALRELPRQGDLRPVDGQDPAALPGRAFGTGGEDLPVQALERGLVQLLPRLAGRRRCRGLVLRQFDARRAALLPELAERRPVALPARRDDEAEHEQHDQQAVEHAAALLPARVLACGDGRGGRDQRLEALREPALGRCGAAPFGPCRGLRLSCVTVASEDLPGVLAQRHHVDALARLRLAGPALAGGLPDARPVGRAVARGLEPRLVDEGFAEDGPDPVEALPVVREPTRRHGQRRGGQVPRDHPWKHQEPLTDRSADPAVTARSVFVAASARIPACGRPGPPKYRRARRRGACSTTRATVSVTGSTRSGPGPRAARRSPASRRSRPARRRMSRTLSSRFGGSEDAVERRIPRQATLCAVLQPRCSQIVLAARCGCRWERAPLPGCRRSAAGSRPVDFRSMIRWSSSRTCLTTACIAGRLSPCGKSVPKKPRLLRSLQARKNVNPQVYPPLPAGPGPFRGRLRREPRGGLARSARAAGVLNAWKRIDRRASRQASFSGPSHHGERLPAQGTATVLLAT